MKILNKRGIKFLAASAALLLASSASATTTIHFAFDGGFLMYSSYGSPIAPMGGITGTMTMEISTQPQGPYSGDAYMSGDEPFYGRNWTADASITGYQNVAGGGAPAYCDGHYMCADASISFYWNGNNIPVSAAFGLDPNSGFNPYDVTSIFNMWENGQAAYFDVESLDTDGDGIKGTAIDSFALFNGYTPYFMGIATVTAVCQDVLDPFLNTGLEVCTSIPNGLALPEVTITNPVPVPAAVWLFGSGLLGLAGVARRKRNAV